MNMLARFDARYTAPVLGADEVGTGAWCGPVFVAAAILPSDPEIIRALEIAGLTDSKQMTRSSRERLFLTMEECCVWYSVRSVSAKEIDTLGQGPCLDRLFEGVLYDALRGPCPKSLLIDGSPRDLPWKPTFLEKGDGLSLAIAAASVVAKVHRDRFMIAASEEYPGYGFEAHVGYGTQLHLQRLEEMGPCPLHRRSVRPVRKVIDARQQSPSGASE